jgi:hypothetical protein
MNQPFTALTGLLPETINGWKLSEQKLIGTHDDLYDYIDGGAELYISYNFSSVVSNTYSSGDEPEVMVEIFDMVEPKNAFGVFSHTRYKEEENYGQGSQYITGALFFWKSRYYISIMTPEETPASKALLFSLAEWIDKAIKETGEKPEILQKLPAEGLDADSVLYFHHYIWLNSFYYISGDNILNIDDSVDAALAKYGPKDKRYYLLMVVYPSDDKATTAYNNFTEHYFPEAEKTNVGKLEDSTWFGCRRINNSIAAVFNAHEKSEVQELLDKIGC